jgi:uncharacterized membrane protein
VATRRQATRRAVTRRPPPLPAAIPGSRPWRFWLGSLIGLVLGLVALKQIKHGHQGGRGIAIAGVVLSVLWLLGLVVAIIVGASK